MGRQWGKIPEFILELDGGGEEGIQYLQVLLSKAHCVVPENIHATPRKGFAL